MARGSYDHAQRRKAQRNGREKGCRVYIAGEELEAAGFGDADDVYYRVWGTKRGGVMLQLYKEPLDERQRSAVAAGSA